MEHNLAYNVLSTTSKAPRAWTKLAICSISTTFIVGLVGDSTQTNYKHCF